MEKYQVSNYSKTDQARHENAIQLSTGEFLCDIATKYKVPSSSVFKAYANYGEQGLYKFCQDYKINTTLPEQILADLLKGEFPEIRHFNKFPMPEINRKPDFKLEKNNRTLYVNIDGLFWHSEKQLNRKDTNAQDYHINLQQKFEEHNLTIFQFRESELRDKSEIVKSIILNYLGIHEKKYHARKLTIKKVTYEDTCKFFNENHLMGTTPSTGYGLYDNEELISCLSVRWKSKESRELEIARFASKLNCAVRGGFSRLLKHIEKEYEPDSIISFCDMRYSTGTSYEKNQFENVQTTLGWNWTNNRETFNRLQCRANMDKRKLTQEQHAQELGWHKIFDAGQRKYKRSIKKS